jgi:trigger factor
LKGLAVEFKITLNRVLQLHPAAINEELFAKYGVEQGGEEQFRKEVSENMARELKNAVQAKLKQQVMDAVLAAHKSLEVPKALVDQEIGVMRNQMFQQFGGAGNQNLDLKSLLPDTMFLENAERRVKLGLVLAEFIAKHELRADGERVRDAIAEMATTYQNPQLLIIITPTSSSLRPLNPKSWRTRWLKNYLRMLMSQRVSAAIRKQSAVSVLSTDNTYGRGG